MQAQTYKVDSGAPEKTQSEPQQAPAGDQQLGWGSNIQNARYARAAQLALQRGDHAQAVEYARRAAEAAPNDSQLWFLYGYAARLDGKLQLSADAYGKGLRISSTPEGLSGLAQTYSAAGRIDDAEKLLKQALAADPRRKDDALLLGDLSMRAGDYNGALEWLGKAERMQPNARSEVLMALSYQHLKQMDMASRYLEMARHRAPDNPDVERTLAGYYREVGKYDEAIAALKAIKNPKADVKAELAYTYQLGGKLEEAAAMYTQAANAMPKDLGLQLSAAQAQIAVNSFDKAQDFLGRAAKIDAEYYRLHAIRAEIAQLQEHPDDAVREYNAAIAHLPATPVEGPLYGIQLHMDLVELYRQINDPGASHQQLEIAQNQIKAVSGEGAGRVQFLRLRALIEMNAGQLDLALNDARDALALASDDPNNLQLNGDLLMKLGKTDAAIDAYKKILGIDPANRFALISLGYASRAAGHDHDAEMYFKRLAQTHPSLYIPYLALGDFYTSRRDFSDAQTNYQKAYGLAPQNALVVAGGMNAGIEAHKLDIAGEWLGHVTPAMLREPQILREKERYLSFKGDYAASAATGEEAIKVLPHDRDVVVYLGYDLLNLKRYDDLLKLTSENEPVLPKEPDLPLLAGYVHKQRGEMPEAEQDFSQAIQRDPNVVTAYVNRGYVLNDLRQPQRAAADFEAAIAREPHNGEAHLGLAYASLDLHKPQAALKQVSLAEAELGDSLYVHLIRATAYGREGMLSKSADEYRLALKFDPNDPTLHFGLGSTLFSEREYHDAIAELQTAERLSPDDPNVYALMARAYANLQDKEQTLHYAQLAEQHAQSAPNNRDGVSTRSAILVSTGEALSTVGDQGAAMTRFREALLTPNSNRVEVRLAISQLMAEQGHADDAKRQIALALMEANTGETMPPTGQEYIAAADVFRGLHEYQLSADYLERAKAAGAPDIDVRVGLANNYLAIGDTARAKAELAAVSRTDENQSDYQYLMAQASIFQQEHQGTQALTAFAQAANASGEDQSAEQNLLQAGANEGYRINNTVSLLSDFSVQPIFEDSTVYVLDSKVDAPTPVPPSNFALLPPPRWSLQTQWTGAYHLHFLNSMPASGFFQVRNAQGTISVPSTSSIVHRNTTDYALNFGVDPTVHFGRNIITFNSGIQGTIRRDSQSPAAMNQNLFRVFTYASTSSFFNAVAVDGYVIRESGPFTESNLSSTALAGAIDFRVGQPWGKTALITGWGANDQKFTPAGIEDYYTASYVGLSRRFSDRLSIRALAEDLRAWRTFGTRSGIAQALRPAGRLDFSPARNWDMQASTAYSNTRGFHVYDMFQSAISVSYARALARSFNAESGEVRLQYPIRFAAGLQQETFPNFSKGQNQKFEPYVSITLF